MKFKKLLEQFLGESSLSRILQHIDDGKVFGVISASRSNFSKKENQERTKQLEKALKDLRLGFIKVKGGYKEESGFVYEDSFFIPNIKRNDLIELGKEYDQYSIIHSDGKTFLEIGTNKNAGIGKKLNVFKYGEIELATDKVKEFFSALLKGSHKGKKFLFKLSESDESSLYDEEEDRKEGFNKVAYGSIGKKYREQLKHEGEYVDGYEPEN